MKIAFFEIKDWEKQYIEARLSGHELTFFSDKLTAETSHLAKGQDAVSVFIYSKIDKDVVDALDARLIATRSTGYDHIDLEACRARGITVSNVPLYGENTVAEHTFALILSLSRNVHKSYVRTLHNDFSIEGLKGFDLQGKTLGVIGAGRIGLHVIRIARGFGMKVLAYDVNKDAFMEEVLGFRYVNLEELLPACDIISLHVPYNKFTHHLINRQNISSLKKGAILINTSRGAVVDTAALIQALDSGILGGAGLDVIEGEEHIKDEKQLLEETSKVEDLRKVIEEHMILHKDNVVFTPHIAFYSQEALERILDTTIKNVLEFSEQRLVNVLR